MSSELNRRDYQVDAVRFLLERGSGAIFADPGLGKTAIVLSLVKILKSSELLSRSLVVSPLRPTYSVWPNEIAKWNPFSSLSYSILHGPDKDERLRDPSDVFFVNVEGLKWFFEAIKRERLFRFDLLVVDESTKFKNPTGKRTRLLRRNLWRFARRVILTGTPVPNSYLDLFSQIGIVDRGETFGTKIGPFRDKYFMKTGFMGYQWKLKDEKATSIEKKIAPLVFRVDERDFLDLPDLIVNDVRIDLQDRAAEIYSEMERRLFTEIDETKHFASTAGHKYLICRQIASGGFYQSDDPVLGIPGSVREVVEVHSQKIDALVDLIEELGGKPVLVPYIFKHELDRLRKALGKSVPYIGSGVSGKASDKLVQQWNRGEIPALLCQPASMSHGLNLQGGGNDIIWITLTDNPEDYEQLNRRIYRSGVSGQVRIHRLIAADTVDEAIVLRLKTKANRQKSLLWSLKQYRKEKGK
jgi:SNF2 family DNA or RNA helicase